MRLLFVVGIAALVLLFLPAAGTADETSPGSVGPYVGGGLNGSFENFDTELIDFDDAVGLDFRGGYRFRQWVAAELHYEWAGTFDGDALGAEVDLYYYGLSGKFYPLDTTRIQPYGLLGLGILVADFETDVLLIAGNDSGAAFRLGAGVETPVLDSLNRTLEAAYVLPAGDVDDLQYVSLGAGVVWYFGSLLK